jgi:hypothetical protein
VVDLLKVCGCHQSVFCFKDENNTEYFIGITPTGIAVYRNKSKINSYFWPRIYKLDYKKTKFYLTVIDKSVRISIIFKIIKNLLKIFFFLL